MATYALGTVGSVYGGPVGAALGAALGAYIDGKYVYPTLFGKKTSEFEPRRLLDLPIGSNGEGAVRVAAFGRRVRVPAHVIWQTRKEREVSHGSQKAGTQVAYDEITFDFAIALNDRQTVGMAQMVGNGKLLTWETRNLVSVRTSEMTVSESGGRLVLTMNSTLDPDFSDKFEVDDRILLSGFRVTSGDDINASIWAVQAVARHGSTPSTLTLDAIDGQSAVGVVADAGTIYSPADVFRADDRWCDTGFTIAQANNRLILDFASVNGSRPSDVFVAGEHAILRNWTNLPNNSVFEVMKASRTTLVLRYIAGNLPLAIGAGTSSSQGVIEPYGSTNYYSEVLPNGMGTFYPGSTTQDPDADIEAEEGVGDVPAYRGVSYSVHTGFKATMFGNSLPTSFECLIDVDRAMTWRDAFAEILRRGGIPDEAIDVSGVNTRPFEGCYLRGATPLLTQLSPMIIAADCVGQERDGVICLFEADDADVVEINNGAQFSDLGAYVGQPPAADEKLLLRKAAPEDMPTSCGIRHQDPDNQYIEGYEFYGLRHPSSPGNENRFEINAPTLVLTRKNARNVTATMLRRIWINSTTCQLTLPASYIHLLENDLLPVTDDDGNDLLLRVVRRESGANWLVEVDAVREELGLAVQGSPVQSVAGNRPPVIVTAADVDGYVFDVPAIADEHTRGPGVVFVAASNAGQHWAGASVFESTDGGSNWRRVAGIASQACLGVTTSDWAAGTAAESLGSSTITTSATSLDIELQSDGPLGTLFSVTTQQAVDGANWCLIVDEDTGEYEIAAFTTATQNTATTWTLGTWLRGLRGTSPVAKLAGARFLMLWPFELSAVFHPMDGLQRDLQYKFVPPGKTVDDVVAVGVQAKWRNASPLPVRDVEKAINGTTSVRFTVDHWTRTVLPVGSTGPYPLDETYEAYRFDLWNASRTAIVYRKTITARGTGSPALRDKWVEFTASECTAAGYMLGPGETFWLDVVQVGDYGESPSNLQEV